LRLYIARQAYTDKIADPMRLTRYAELGCTVCILCSSVYVVVRSAVCVNFGLLWSFCRLSSCFSPLRELCGAIIICCSKVDLAVLFGLLAFLLNFVPNVGAVLDAPLAAASMRRSMLPCITADRCALHRAPVLAARAIPLLLRCVVRRREQCVLLCSFASDAAVIPLRLAARCTLHRITRAQSAVRPQLPLSIGT
jgi:hypothetical protein